MFLRVSPRNAEGIAGISLVNTIRTESGVCRSVRFQAWRGGDTHERDVLVNDKHTSADSTLPSLLINGAKGD